MPGRRGTGVDAGAGVLRMKITMIGVQSKSAVL